MTGLLFFLTMTTAEAHKNHHKHVNYRVQNHGHSHSNHNSYHGRYHHHRVWVFGKWEMRKGKRVWIPGYWKVICHHPRPRR